MAGFAVKRIAGIIDSEDRRGFPVEELRELVREGIDSGPSLRVTMAEVRAEARRRLESARLHHTSNP